MSQRTEAKARTREALLDAARTVIGRNGLHASRLDLIAAEAGFSTGAVYASFNGKDDLFTALIDREVVRFLSEFAAVVEQGSDVADRSQRAIRALLDYLEREPDFFVLVMELWSRAIHEEAFQTFYLERRALITQALALILEEGARSSGRELVLPALKIATVVEALGEGIALRFLADPGTVSSDDFDEIAELLSGALTRPSTATGEDGPSAAGRGERDTA
ncbi:MAG TPA: TetR/AcrR family transcriptional regulator [Nocardioidaceae bacterium]|nr:TetR/AcrR family transcriptional regulator [Nocardioidaceae bacterium]